VESEQTYAVKCFIVVDDIHCGDSVVCCGFLVKDSELSDSINLSEFATSPQVSANGRNVSVSIIRNYLSYSE
jgi:hypothetical protein